MKSIGSQYRLKKSSAPTLTDRVEKTGAAEPFWSEPQCSPSFSMNLSKLCHFDFAQGLLQYYDDLCQEVPTVFVNLMTPKMKKVGGTDGSC